MPSIFSRIVAGEIPCHKIAEDDRFLAFLDIQPLAEGHTLVIPKLEVDRYFDLPDDLPHHLVPPSKKKVYNGNGNGSASGSDESY